PCRRRPLSPRRQRCTEIAHVVPRIARRRRVDQAIGNGLLREREWSGGEGGGRGLPADARPARAAIRGGTADLPQDGRAFPAPSRPGAATPPMSPPRKRGAMGLASPLEGRGQ